MDNFANRLKEARLAKGMTEQELADKLHVTRQAVSKWENGINYPDVELLPEISKLLDLDLDYLLSGEKRPPKVEYVEQPPEVKYVEKPVYYQKSLIHKRYIEWHTEARRKGIILMIVMAPVMLLVGVILMILSLTGVIVEDRNSFVTMLGVAYCILAGMFLLNGLLEYKLYEIASEDFVQRDISPKRNFFQKLLHALTDNWVVIIALFVIFIAGFILNIVYYEWGIKHAVKYDSLSSTTSLVSIIITAISLVCAFIHLILYKKVKKEHDEAFKRNENK